MLTSLVRRRILNKAALTYDAETRCSGASKDEQEILRKERMMGEVTSETFGHVALITISSIEVRNSLTPDMGRQLSDICNVINEDSSIGAAVVRGDGATFCSGADTRQWGEHWDPASPEGYANTAAIYDAFVRVGELKVPTVAAVRGAAVGAGINLFLATDLRVVATDARLLAGFLRIGIHPGGGFFTLAGRAAGRETAAALGLFGQEVSGIRAVEIGLAWQAVPDEEVESRAMEIAEIAARDPELVRHALATYRSELGPPPVSWPAALEMERGIQMWSQRRRQIHTTDTND
jgi:enoyl-CoA hydratase